MTDKEYQDLIRNLELYADIEESSLHRRAADAIEELEAELERVKRELQKSEHDNVNLTGELAKVAAELGRANRESEWNVFELISSAYYGKQYYFKQDNGQVYSRATGAYQSQEDAIADFIDNIRSI